MNSTALAKKKIITFIALTAAFSAVFYSLIISAGTLGAAGGFYVLGLMWSPGAAAMITQLIFERRISGLGWKPGRFKYLLIAFLLPLVYCTVVYGITWGTGLGGLDPDMMAAIGARWGGLTGSPFLQVVLTVVISSLVTTPFGLLSALGEEIGWRGLFVPELLKVTTFNKAMLISGAVWALYHYPLLFFADYNMAGAPVWYGGLMFTIMVLGISFAFGWLTVKSGSLWPAAVLHASHNVAVQSIFTPLTQQNTVTPFIIDEFGAGLALAGIVIALVIWQVERTGAPVMEPGV